MGRLGDLGMVSAFLWELFCVFANVLDHVGHGVVDANRGVHRPCCYLGEKALECCYRGGGGVRLDRSIVILLLYVVGMLHPVTIGLEMSHSD